jgi:hypothetical protein
MPVFELGKSIESIRLNKRNRLPMGDPPRTIPFGALIDEIRETGDRASFVYLGELYECPADLLRSALLASTPAQPNAPFEPNGGGDRTETGTRATAPKQPASLEWEPLASSQGSFSRARVPGGWLLMSEANALVFIPDPERVW